MAAALLRAEAERRGVGGVEVTSAGTWGQDGSPATELAAHVMGARGLNISGHIARTVSTDDLEQSDLVVVMTSVHGRELENLSRDTKEKVRLLRELAELEIEPVPGASPEERLGALLAAARPPWRRALDLDDPYGMPLNVYERTASDIEEAVRQLAEKLFGPPPASGGNEP
jgi:protein-tyrosine phosphatase